MVVSMDLMIQFLPSLRNYIIIKIKIRPYHNCQTTLSLHYNTQHYDESENNRTFPQNNGTQINISTHQYQTKLYPLNTNYSESKMSGTLNSKPVTCKSLIPIHRLGFPPYEPSGLVVSWPHTRVTVDKSALSVLSRERGSCESFMDTSGCQAYLDDGYTHLQMSTNVYKCLRKIHEVECTRILRTERKQGTTEMCKKVESSTILWRYMEGFKVVQEGKELQGRTVQGRTLQGRTLQGRTLQGRTLQGLLTTTKGYENV